eukprot:jgi/Mesvir1/17003/Mv19379-RA.1
MMHTWFRPSDDFLIGGVVNGVRAYDPWHRPSDLDMIKSEEVDVADSDDDAHKSVVAGMTSRNKLTEEERVKIAIAAATVEYKKQLDEMERKYRVQLLELETNQRTKIEGDVSAERERVTNKFKEEKEQLLNEFKQRLDEARSETARTAEKLNRLKESNKEFLQRVRLDMDSKTAEIARLNDAMSSLNTEKTSLENRIAELVLQAANGGKAASEARTERDVLQQQLEDVKNRLSEETASGHRLREELETTQRAGEDLVNSLKRELEDAQDAAQTAYNRDIGRLLNELTTLHVRKTESEEGAKTTINNMIEEKKQEIEELRATHERIMREREASYETTIRQIEERNREASDQAAALETELRDEIGRLGELSNDMKDTIQTMIQRHAEETTITTNEINRLKDKLTTIEAEKQSLQEHIDQMNDQALSSAYDGSEMERTLAVLRGKIAESDKHRELLYQNEQALLSQTAELQEKLSEVKSELEARVSAHKAEVRSVLDSQTLTLQQKEQEMERLREDKDALSQQHADVTSELGKARAEYDKLRETHAAELRRVREEAEEQARAARKEVSSVREEQERTAQLHRDLETQLATLRNETASANEAWEARISDEMRKAEKLMESLTSRETSLGEMVASNEKLAKRITDLEAEKSEIAKKEKALHEEKAGLNDDITRMTEEALRNREALASAEAHRDSLSLQIKEISQKMASLQGTQNGSQEIIKNMSQSALDAIKKLRIKMKGLEEERDRLVKSEHTLREKNVSLQIPYPLIPTLPNPPTPTVDKGKGLDMPTTPASTSQTINPLFAQLANVPEYDIPQQVRDRIPQWVITGRVPLLEELRERAIRIGAITGTADEVEAIRLKDEAAAAARKQSANPGSGSGSGSGASSSTDPGPSSNAISGSNASSPTDPGATIITLTIDQVVDSCRAIFRPEQP